MEQITQANRPPDPALMLKEPLHEEPIYRIDVRSQCGCCHGHSFELDREEYIATMKLVAKLRGYAAPEVAHA